ncbi:YacL family protein [Vibrio hannami]|uniref:UPF0231 family protein n=1 Tax=Vibrio hannami TaxID=2717094 RepID=UPI00240ED164|nr:YacL family protein [Vibrio hannami]MDG3087162.1 YacL family protein [Vibrio hannami]
MEFQFTKNSLTGGLHIKCSMGHEVVARWLEEELTTNKQKVTELLVSVGELKSGDIQELTIRGTEISAYLTTEEVVIQENVLAYGEEMEADSEFDFYDSESTSACGLEDFEDLLKSLLEFIS